MTYVVLQLQAAKIYFQRLYQAEILLVQPIRIEGVMCAFFLPACVVHFCEADQILDLNLIAIISL